jgi:CheY-specific phosphatase CheX
MTNFSAVPASMSAFEVELLFTSTAFAAAGSLFEAYALSVAPVGFEAYRRNPTLTLVSVVGFAGREISGSLVLGASSEPLLRSNPTQAPQRDWIGELANQLLGRVKNKIARHGIEIYAVPPSVVSGEHLAPVTSVGDFAPLVFSTPGGGIVCLWIDLAVAPELRLADLLVGGIEIPNEGDVILF